MLTPTRIQEPHIFFISGDALDCCPPLRGYKHEQVIVIAVFSNGPPHPPL